MRTLTLLLLIVSVAACGETAGVDTSTTPAPLSSSSAPTTAETQPSTSTTSAPTTTLPPDAVPPEIRGYWVTTEADDGAEVKLTLTKTNFTLNRSNIPGVGAVQSGGRATVVGDTIEFSKGENCQGTGRYRWGLADGKLTFASLGEDECGRKPALDGITYTLEAPLP